jgi:colanic acid biosynthesis glycosyl transferase WcaI
MDFLVISQVFWPDTASTAQHLFDLAEELTQEGHTVTVYCSRYAYENNKIKFPLQEKNRNIQIFRIKNTGFGKKHMIGRLIDFASFNLLLFFKLFRIRKKAFDAVIGMTSPPLVSFLGVYMAKRKNMRFIYWVMDLQPELAIASGLIKKNSVSAKIFERIGNYIIRNADCIIVLDNYMRDYILKRGGNEEHIYVIPVWAVMEKYHEVVRKDNPFRIHNDFGERLVVMYSGNHSYIHPLDTLLNAILHFKCDPDFLFVFIGDGVRKKDVTKFIELHQLANVLQLPYQPRSNIHNSIGSSDMQVVIMGEAQVGYTHPNKIYGAMFMGKPVLYIGPDSSHVTDILNETEGNIIVRHNHVEELVKKLMSFKLIEEDQMIQIGYLNRLKVMQDFDPVKLKSQMVKIVTSV